MAIRNNVPVFVVKVKETKANSQINVVGWLQK